MCLAVASGWGLDLMIIRYLRRERNTAKKKVSFLSDYFDGGISVSFISYAQI